MVFATEKRQNQSRQSQSEKAWRGPSDFKQDLLGYRAKKITRGESFHRAEQDILRTRAGSLASAKDSTLLLYLTY